MSEFKVMPWLRKIREEHAMQQAGLTDAEKIEQDRQAANEIKDRLFHRRTSHHRSPVSRVAEDGPEYGKK
jgi:hypothetical protein